MMEQKNLVKIFSASAFPQGEVRASMPTSLDFFYCPMKCSVARLCQKQNRSKTPKQKKRAPGRLANRKHPENVITRCDRNRNCESVAPNLRRPGKKDPPPFV